jgi:hypothetical protein
MVHIGAGLDERPRIAVRLLDHEVHLDGQAGDAPNRLHRINAQREIRDEMAVHHVDVEGIDLRRLQPLHLGLDLTEIGGEQAGGNPDRAHVAI